jgi:hypothetical protein
VAQGYPPRRSARRGYPDDPGSAPRPSRRGREERPGRPRLDSFDDGPEEDLSPWAGPGIYPAGPGRRERRPPAERAGPPGTEEAEWAGPPGTERAAAGPRAPGAERNQGRRAATRARKSRRRVLAAGGLGAVVVLVVVLGLTGNLPWQGHPAPSASDGLVTTFQRGEFQSVPNACQAVSAATLGQYLPGKVSKVAQALSGTTQSECTWTLDARPDFRVLTVNSQAYAPSLLSSGDGSATFGAMDAYAQQMQTLQNPPKSSRAPKAQLGAAVGLGPDAFTALQVFHVGRDTTDEVTVVVRDRNVLIIVTMQGQEHGGGFGPVPVATLRAAALAAAHDALAGIR